MKKLPRSKKVLEWSLEPISAIKSFRWWVGGGWWVGGKVILMSAPGPLTGVKVFSMSAPGS